MSVVSKEYNFGTASPTDVVDWSFEFTNIGNIEYINTGCSCTTATKLEGNTYSGVLDISRAGVYKEKETKIEKNMVVYFNDGQPHFNVSDLKVLKPNPGKTTLIITIKGTVIQE